MASLLSPFNTSLTYDLQTVPLCIVSSRSRVLLEYNQYSGGIGIV